jgi:GT2 family glycosyltransferase
MEYNYSDAWTLEQRERVVQIVYTSRVSIIIPYSRKDLIETVLTTLTQQTYPVELTEIIVVGANSSVLEKQWPIKAIDTEPLYYPGEGRNKGARVATGGYLLFLDDDCEAAPDWIEQNVRALMLSEVGAVGGQIKGKSKCFFAQCVDFSSFAFSQVNKRMEIQICSASMGVKREVYEQVQGFDETLRTCEDIDFCYKLVKAGYKTIYEPAIKVVHNHRRTRLRTLLQYSYFYGRVSGLEVKLRYPGMTKRNRWLTSLRHPLIYAAMLFPVSLGITGIIVRLNWREYPQMLLYAPFIFMAKISFHIGILQWLIQGAI